MTQPSAFVVHAGDLLSNSGKRRPHRLAGPVEWGMDFVEVAAETPIEADLVLSGVSGGVLVRGRLNARMVMTCVRCLEESSDDVELEIAQLVEGPGAAGDDGYELDGEDIDLEPILRDELMLQMPLRPVCQGGCEGLEPPPETDLNTDSPDEPERSSPFAVLQDLFDPGD